MTTTTVTIPIYDELSYDHFLRDHLLPNTPFLLSSKATESWEARGWTLDSLRVFSKDLVPVADTQKREFSEFSRSERPLCEILDLWEKNDPSGADLYIKDWHLAEGYEVPECFRDDWLADPPNFGFTYIGPKGTWTPIHRDVYASYSWSANLKGRKAWWLFPPGTSTEDFYDVRRDGDEGAVKLTQEEGQIIFVPSGWYHQVINLDFCISVNHNFFSAPTLSYVYKALDQGQLKVEESIEDVREMIIDRVGSEGPWEKEWVEEVQKLLAMDAGWNWHGFWSTVVSNVKHPPAPSHLSPPVTTRDRYLHEIITLFRSRWEWHLLPETRKIVQEITSIITINQTADY